MFGKVCEDRQASLVEMDRKNNHGIFPLYAQRP